MDLRIECDDAPQWSGKGSLRHWTWRGTLVGESQKLEGVRLPILVKVTYSYMNIDNSSYR